jgi:ketosteroid isomerase-like protein
MSVEETTALLGRVYPAYATADVAAIDALISADCVMHVSGHHPLSGDYDGKDAIWGYLGKVATISGGRGGFDVTSVLDVGRSHVMTSNLIHRRGSGRGDHRGRIRVLIVATKRL